MGPGGALGRAGMHIAHFQVRLGLMCQVLAKVSRLKGRMVLQNVENESMLDIAMLTAFLRHCVIIGVMKSGELWIL